MAKKSKKSRKQRAPRTTFERPVHREQKVEAAEPLARASQPKRGEQVDFKQEYRYVVKDLRLLGIIAAIMLVLLLVLSLLIT